MTPVELAEAIARDPNGTGLILDFDGTLAPIVDNPATSAMSTDMRAALTSLAQRLAVVAIVSGRPASFLGERAAVPNVRLLGLYGTEEWRDGVSVARPEASEWVPALDEARDRLALALVGHHGVVLEDKGLAVALHWRNAEDTDGAGAFVICLVAEVARDTGLAQEPGKLVAELRPPLAWDKGTAAGALVADLGLHFPVYMGDDLGDLPALRAVRSAGGAAVVVDHGSETPPELREAADVVLDGVEAVEGFMEDLAASLPSAYPEDDYWPDTTGECQP